MHKNINLNLFSVSISAETRMEAEILFRFGIGHKNLFRPVTNFYVFLIKSNVNVYAISKEEGTVIGNLVYLLLKIGLISIFGTLFRQRR